MDPGEKLAVPCINFHDQESKRVNLYRERKKFSERASINIEEELAIYRAEIQGKLYVILEKKKAYQIGNAFIIKEDGTTSTIQTQESSINDLSGKEESKNDQE
jgi:hypothetical protein